MLKGLSRITRLWYLKLCFLSISNPGKDFNNCVVISCTIVASIWSLRIGEPPFFGVNNSEISKAVSIRMFSKLMKLWSVKKITYFRLTSAQNFRWKLFSKHFIGSKAPPPDSRQGPWQGRAKANSKTKYRPKPILRQKATLFIRVIECSFVRNLILAFQKRNFDCIFSCIQTNFSLLQTQQDMKLLFRSDDNYS